MLLLALVLPVGAVADETNAPAPAAEATTHATAESAAPIVAAEETDVHALIEVLQKRYVAPSEVSRSKLDAAAVTGIVAALGPGAELVDDGDRAGSKKDLPGLARCEMVAPMIGYVRLNSVDVDTLGKLDEALKKLDNEKIDSLVIDLRFADGASFDAAAELASRFLLKGKELFAVQSAQAAAGKPFVSSQPSAYIDWKLAVLINAKTSGAAEAVAASLRAQGRAILVGSKTAGKAVSFSEEKLPSGARVRIATQKVVLQDGTELFPNGIAPDVVREAKLEDERKILFELSQGKKMREFVEEEEIEKQLNEAALVKMLRSGDTNEAPADVEKAGGAPATTAGDSKEEKKKLPLDAPLQRAVDILKGIRILHLE